MPPRDRRMIVLHGVAIIESQQKPIAILVDTGCAVSCMPETTARRLGIPFRRTRHNKVAVLADGSERPMNYEAILTLRLGPSYTCNLRIDLSAGTLAPKDMLLGMDWLCTVNPKINFRPLSLKVTDKNGRTWEIVGMRPPGQPHFCRNHGYRCREDTHGRYGDAIPSGMRTGGGGFGRRMPYAGFGQAISIFRQEVKETNELPCTCDEAFDEEKKRTDWRDLFPDRDWYPHSDCNNSADVLATEKLRLLQEITENGKEKSSSKEQLNKTDARKPKTTHNVKGTMPLTKAKVRPERYELFRWSEPKM